MRDSTVRNKKYEEYVEVLDFLPFGFLLSDSKRPAYLREPLVQVIGEKYLTLLELVTTKDAFINLHDRLNINPRVKQKQDSMLHVKRRITVEELTPTAKRELPFAIERIVKTQETHFVEFFNNARPITTRMHQLELLPGIGTRFLVGILDERKKSPFTSFADIEARTRIHPQKMIEKRILAELEGTEKRYLFTRPPLRQGNHDESLD